MLDKDVVPATPPYSLRNFTGFYKESKNSGQNIPIFGSQFYSKSKTRKKEKTKTINTGVNLHLEISIFCYALLPHKIPILS